MLGVKASEGGAMSETSVASRGASQRGRAELGCLLKWSFWILVALSAAAHADELVTTKQELSVTGAPWTLIQTAAGDIEGRTGPADHVYIEMRRRAPTKDQAQALTRDVSYQRGVVRIGH